ncbi:hypothetical protein PVL29_024171 [Vitis rotundifolia]|uniref:Flavin-containing monooxygenase n=1 Tax=Vitis rotundifolia TaxID=103349 RepID=A0AA39D8P4_VITRO|nr:hypothetical protein PVL29_024171 [Vitis rotundifolia]
MEEVVIIVGAGPSGLATSACLNVLSIPNIILEREDCFASLWKKRSYDRLKLHLGKQFCQLPHMPYPPGTPTFIPKAGFLQYLEDYVSHFQINPRYHRFVESASYDKVVGKWHIVAKNTLSDELEVYLGKFLVVATGENSEGLIPKIPGLDSFGGEFMHCSNYKNGKRFTNKEVLVVGCGNSGMEIAYDLWDHGAVTSVVVRNPVHVVTKEMVLLGMFLLKYIPCKVVDYVTVSLAKLIYGDLSSYGLPRPSEGPFYLKDVTRSSPIIDVGTIEKIKKGEIQVVPTITKIEGDYVYFSDGKMNRFDAIIFATGYKSTVLKWLKESEDLFNEDGMPKKSFPNHWNGENGLYCVGFASRGLFGIARDAEHIANHISGVVSRK